MGTDRLSRNVGNYQSTLRNIPEEGKVVDTAVEAWNHAYFKTFWMNYYYYYVIITITIILCILRILYIRTAWHSARCYSDTCMSTLDGSMCDNKRHHVTACCTTQPSEGKQQPLQQNPLSGV